MIRHRGEPETVCDDDFSRLQRRPHHLSNENRPRRIEEQKLRFGRNVATVQQDLTNLFTNRGAARFARDQVRNAVRLQPVGQQAHLCTFAGAFRALEHEEETAHVSSEIASS